MADDQVKRWRSIADLDARAGQPVGEALREAAGEVERLREEAAELRTTLTLLGGGVMFVREHTETVTAELGRFKAAVATMREDHEGCAIGAFDGCQTCIALETLERDGCSE